MRPCRPPAARPAGCPGVLRPRRPGLTFLPLLVDRRSPPERTLPPSADDELVRQECDGTRSHARKSGCAENLVAQGSTTRSSRWMTSCGEPVGQVARCGARRRPEGGRGVPDQALGERHARRRRRSRPRRRRRTRPRRRGPRPAAASDRPSTTARGGRRRRPRPGPAAPRANAIQSLRLGRRSAAGRHDGADRPPGDRVGDHVGRRRPRRSPPARPTTPRSSPPRACWPSRRSPARCPAPPATRLERGVDLDDLLDQRRVRVEAGIGGEQPGGVGEQHEQRRRRRGARRARRGGRCRRSGSRRRRRCRSR